MSSEINIPDHLKPPGCVTSDYSSSPPAMRCLPAKSANTGVLGRWRSEKQASDIHAFYVLVAVPDLAACRHDERQHNVQQVSSYTLNNVEVPGRFNAALIAFVSVPYRTLQ